MAQSVAVEGGTRKIRVLHALGRLGAGGVETWLVHALRRIDRGRFQLDFVVSTDEPGAYDEEVRALGGRVLPCMNPHRPWTYARALLRILEEHGPYDAMHAHLHHFSGLDLWAANRAGVPLRICQSHIDSSADDRLSSLPRKGYLAFARAMISQQATHLLAVSEQAGRALYGDAGLKDPRYDLMRCGVDFERFAAPVDREQLRRQLGIPEGAKVLGTVGRLAPQKNHAFLLAVASELVRRDRSWQLVMVGDGPLRARLHARAFTLGLRGHVIWAGARTDVENVLPALDAFVFPSLAEGLALAPLEAQAAGVPCLYSEAMPLEAGVVDGLVRRLPLSAGVLGWADAIEAAITSPSRPSPTRALAQMRLSPFDIDASTGALEALYEQAPSPSSLQRGSLAQPVHLAP